MNWFRTHQAQTIGGIFLFFGLLLLVCPQAAMPKKKLDQLKKIQLPGGSIKQKDSDEKMPLALNLFLRFFGLILMIAGAAAWYAGTR